jgi:hypothetical protein
MHYVENKSVRPYVHLSVCQSVRLPVCLSVDTKLATKMLSDLKKISVQKFFTKSCRPNVSFMNISSVEGVPYYRQKKRKAIPVQTYSGPNGFRRLQCDRKDYIKEKF